MKSNDSNDTSDAVLEKLEDAATVPGFQSEFDPVEAEKAGAFEEDALSEEDAIESSIDTDNIG